MARGRMIDKRISNSKKLGRISDKARVLYFMIYPHLDCEGRIVFDDLEDLKDEIMPKFNNWPLSKIAASLNELADIGLISLYSDRSKIAMQFDKFGEFQVGMRKDREAPSKINAPGTTPENSGVLRITPALRKEIKVKEGIKKEERNKYSEELDQKYAKFWARYPNKQDNGKAKEKWLHLVVAKGVDPERIEIALTGYINCLNSKKTPPEYIKMAKTFLFAGNEKRKIPSTWEQYLPYADPKYKTKAPL